MTPGQAIRRFCMECVGASTARGAFDCLCSRWPCPLYAANPFRGKPMPKSKAAPREMIPQYVLREDAELAEIASRIPRRRASRTLIRAYCRTCQPGDRSDCEATDRVISGMRFPQCPLYPYRPWPGPGHAMTQGWTDQRRAAVRVNLSESGRPYRFRQAPKDPPPSTPQTGAEAIQVPKPG